MGDLGMVYIVIGIDVKLDYNLVLVIIVVG